jgi:hypothetical protein
MIKLRRRVCFFDHRARETNLLQTKSFRGSHDISLQRTCASVAASRDLLVEAIVKKALSRMNS